MLRGPIHIYTVCMYVCRATHGSLSLWAGQGIGVGHEF